MKMVRRSKFNVQISGAPKIAPEAELVTLAATSPTETNSIENPQKMFRAPKEPKFWR